MKRDYLMIYEDSLPLSELAIAAMRRLHEAEAAGLPDVEVARLRAEAESLFQAVSDYQLRAMGVPSPPLQ